MPSVGAGDDIGLVEAAELLGMSPRTLDRWARQGRVQSELTDDGSCILRRAEVERMAVGPDDRASPS